MKIFLLFLKVGNSKTVKFGEGEASGTNSDSADIISGSGSTEVNSINTVDHEPNNNPRTPPISSILLAQTHTEDTPLSGQQCELAARQRILQHPHLVRTG